MKSTKNSNIAAIFGVSLLLALAIFVFSGVNGGDTFAYPGSNQVTNNGYPGPTSGNEGLSGYPGPNTQSANINRGDKS